MWKKRKPGYAAISLFGFAESPCHSTKKGIRRSICLRYLALRTEIPAAVASAAAEADTSTAEAKSTLALEEEEGHRAETWAEAAAERGKEKRKQLAITSASNMHQQSICVLA